MKHSNDPKAKIGSKLSLEVEAKKANGDVYNEIDKYSKLVQTAHFSGNKIEEKTIVKSPKEIKKLLQRSEKEVVEGLLPAYNRKHNSNYFIDASQPPEYDSTDVKIIDKTTQHYEEVQVTVSDSQAFENLGRNKGRFERRGEINELLKAALDKAINEKMIIYPIEVRQNLTLVLDGWRLLKSNHLDFYTEKQQQFMKDSGFKEIWFVGYTDETVLRLFP